MEQEKVLAQKKENLEKLIQNLNEAIRNEMLKYDEAEFCIRLQSECFGLYPVVVKALSLLIADDKRREVFCSFVKGHKLERLAAFHNLTPEEAVQMFRSTIREVHERINNGAFTAKESVNIRLLMERDRLKCQLKDYSNLYKMLQLKYQKANDELNILQETLNQKTEEEQSTLDKKVRALRKEIRKELQEKMKRQLEMQTEEKTAKDSPLSAFMRWMRCLKITL